MRILVIEDNIRLASNIERYLKLENYTVDVFHNGKEAFIQASRENYDVIILDVNLPEMSGIEICTLLRKNKKNTPIIMLTSISELEEKVHSLNIGADDYITKPFEFDELIARIKVQLRHNSKDKTEIIAFHNIECDIIEKNVYCNNVHISLSPKEFAILEYLLRNRGIPKSRGQILEHVWGNEGDHLELYSDTVEVHIAYLRKKLGKDCIITKRGYGYYIQ